MNTGILCSFFSESTLKTWSFKKKKKKKGGGVAMLDKSTVFKIKWMNLIHLRMSKKKKIKNNVDHFKKVPENLLFALHILSLSLLQKLRPVAAWTSESKHFTTPADRR